jgi:hypothetical protein
MSIVAIPDRIVDHGGAGRKKPFVWLLAPVLLVAALAGVIGVRLATQPNGTRASVSTRLPYVPVPTMPAIEAGWGIRFTAVLLEADRGMLDLRYQVVDPAKSGRIHGGKSGANPLTQLANMPSVILESNGQRITPNSALMHFEHFHFQTELLGTTYSLLYGNSGGLLHVADRITIKMADGLELRHVVVAN